MTDGSPLSVESSIIFTLYGVPQFIKANQWTSQVRRLGIRSKTACRHNHGGAETTENIVSSVTLLQNVHVAKTLNNL